MDNFALNAQAVSSTNHSQLCPIPPRAPHRSQDLDAPLPALIWFGVNIKTLYVTFTPAASTVHLLSSGVTGMDQGIAEEVGMCDPSHEDKPAH